MLWNSIIDLFMCVSTPRICFQMPDESETSRLLSYFQVFAFWVSSCCLTWEYTAGFWLVSRIWSQMPDETPPCSALAFPRFSGSLIYCGEFFLVLKRLCDTKFVGLGSAIAEPSLEVPSCPLVDTALCLLFERKCLQETSRISWYSTNEEDGSTHHVWSFFWLPCQQVGSWWAILLIWIFVSELILSNNQSGATLWVLDTCLIVRTSAFNDHFDGRFFVFKNVQLRLALRRMRVCGNVVHMRQLLNISVSLLFGFGWVGVLFVERNTSIITSHKSRANNPSDSVQLWDTGVFFLHIQIMVTAKSDSWKKPNRTTLSRVPTWQYCRLSLAWWMCEINLARRVTRLCPLVTDGANLLTDQRMSGLPMRAKNEHFRKICEHTFDKSPIDSSSSSLNWRSSKQGLDFEQLLGFFCLPVRSISQRMFEHLLPCCRTTQPSLCEGFPHPGNFLLLQQKYVLLNNYFVRFASTLSTSQIHMVKKWCWFVKINIKNKVLPHGSHILLLARHFNIIHVYRQE